MSSSGGGSLHYYNSSTVSTSHGFLNVSTHLGETKWTGYDPFKREYVNMKKTYKSGNVNGWNKFCFTGGIVEIDAIMPGDPQAGGLWPAMWILGNLGRATYEGSTNKIWPWSQAKCNRELQRGQEISGCSGVNHYGLEGGVGRGSTEIDVIEIMPGEPGFLPSTQPKVERPYAAMTLQVAPGVTVNRPNSGQRPVLVGSDGTGGHAPTEPQTWYPDLAYRGNTTLNPFFYGTYLGKTKPEEPVTRTEDEAYQADAVGAMHQMKEAHFAKVHTYRVEWRPGRPGGEGEEEDKGRIDWYVKDTEEGARGRPGGYPYKKKEKKDVKNSDYNSPQTPSPTGWTHAFTILGSSLSITGADIPREPSYLIFNTAVSSTWGFPFDVPPTCKKCYDCSDPSCACALPPGFCASLLGGAASLLIDSVRVYQEPGMENVGCDPVGMPTREFIKGHEYRYMRPTPFVDKGPLKDVTGGGGNARMTLVVVGRVSASLRVRSRSGPPRRPGGRSASALATGWGLTAGRSGTSTTRRGLTTTSLTRGGS